MKLVITKIEREFFKQAPSLIEVTIFNQLGAEQSRIKLPVSIFGTKELEVGQRLLLMPIVEEAKTK